jgi:hypothetical protein
MGYLSTGAITVAVLSLGQEGAARWVLHCVALVLVLTMLWEEIREDARRRCGAATGIALAAVAGYVLLIHTPDERLAQFIFQKVGQPQLTHGLVAE